MLSFLLLQETRIITGYLVTDGKTVCVHRATSMDDIECKGCVPRKFQYTVKFADDRSFNVFCEKELEYIFPFNNGAYILFEGIGSFNIDGLRGRGIMEFGFNGDSSRWTRRTKGVK